MATADGIVKIFHVSRMVAKKTIYVDHELIAIGVTQKEQKRKQQMFQRKSSKPSFDKSFEDNGKDDGDDDDNEDESDDCEAVKDKLLFCFQRHRITDAANNANDDDSPPTAPGVISVYDLDSCLLVQEIHLLGLQVEARHPFAVSQVRDKFDCLRISRV